MWLLVTASALALSYLMPGLSGLAAGEVATLSIIMAWSIGLTTTVSFFVGLLFVAAGGFYHQTWPDRASDGLGVGGTVFWVESSGACLGLLLYSFALIDKVGPFTTFLIFASLVLFFLSITLPTTFFHACMERPDNSGIDRTCSFRRTRRPAGPCHEPATVQTGPSNL